MYTNETMKLTFFFFNLRFIFAFSSVDFVSVEWACATACSNYRKNKNIHRAIEIIEN